MPIEIHDGAPWIFRKRSCGELPADSLNDVLTWVVEQLNFGHFVVERDTQGDGVSLTLGQAAARQTDFFPQQSQQRRPASAASQAGSS
jgi:hypothetical protein